MTDMRRTLLWGVFLVSLFLLFEAWNVQNGRPSLLHPAAPKTAASAPAHGASGGAGAAATAVAASASGVIPSVASEKVEVVTDVVKATFDSRGGTLVHLELLNTPEQIEKPWYEPLLALVGKASTQEAPARNVVLFDSTSQRVYVAETGVLGVAGAPNHLSPMAVVPGERTLKQGVNDLSVSFESAEQGGQKLVKTFVFHRGVYTVDVKHELRNVGTAALPAQQLYLQLTRDSVPGPGGSAFYSTFTGPAVYNEETKFKKLEFKDVDKAPTTLNADNGWVAMVQHYFASAWVHKAQGAREFRVRAIDAAENLYGHRIYTAAILFPVPTLAPGANFTFDSVLFAGPQEENKLSEIAPGLQLVKDYGVLKILAEPLFWLLTQLHKILGNWGWAIVALVVLLKIAFYWLNASAYRSMAKMKAINPKVMELRERYKDKPQQMQQEMMRIYREEKVNPIGGCLPIFVQMPFFISLYWVLLSTVEMRGAPWLGWIHDLSLKDPYFILPILMTATSLVQVALGAKPPDPVQARMMWFMPLAFSVMFFFFPAGLVLYWLTNNILSIAQQYVINKRMGVLNT
ncbi:membrane protein insertase YidC [Piscinibacter terrae]|uniref:Membrane protein insertase YidC n=1 Tax=Piscinibacter terrae TaxID=2496871 RepID=A0A3N7HQ66_9BURK|nr:membrane protein insertase YidC [Albitalea terrae]RQP24340.1 membrane protein insertase YidC [Albitalea terrae]